MTTSQGSTALLLVDLQRDYLDRPRLVPEEGVLVGQVARLLAGFRAWGNPVAHIRTIVRADGTDAMRHWRDNGALICIDGTPGAAPPPALAEWTDELVARKSSYRGFSDPRLDGWLRARGVTGVVIAGVYAHACVRETALDAYERGYDVIIATDGVGTDDPSHAESSNAWLAGRAARFLSIDEILAPTSTAARPEGPDWNALVCDVAVKAAAQQRAWAARSVEERAGVLDSWAREMEARADDLVGVIVAEVFKPLPLARDEVRRAIGHVRTAAMLARQGLTADELIDGGVLVRHVPVGVVGILMPWNNPLALPCGKIASALAFGNGVVFKPAPEAEATASLIIETANAVGIPLGLVGVVTGDARAGSAVVEEGLVTAIAVTGSIATGRAIAARCASLGKPLQAELGGNNAAIVLADADLDEVVPALIGNAFAYSGQRCTAIRRFVVQADILDDFVLRATDAVERLVLGAPGDEATDVGPLITLSARDRVASVVDRARDAGAVVLAGGYLPTEFAPGSWYAPTLLLVDDRESEIVQEETFGPVAVIQRAEDVDDAIAAANGVVQGLLMAVCTSSEDARERVRAFADVGLLQFGAGALRVHPDAPFGGWKASGYGPPEHGRWDAQFLSRPQAVY